MVRRSGEILSRKGEKKGSGSFCLKGPKGAAHKRVLTPFSRRAFTLAELMVSVGVLILLLTMVGMIFKMATDASSQAIANNAVMGRLRTLEHQLRQDIMGLKTDAFIGLWYQIVDSGWPDPNNPGQNIPVRSDRIVFFGTGAQEAKTGDIIVRSATARIFYGHYDLMYPGIPNRSAAQDWILGRRTKLLVSDNNLFIPNAYADQAEYDSWDYEFGTLEDWHTPLVPIGAFFDTSGVMADSNTPNWISRPTIDTTTGTGGHMHFVSDCAGFKVQRWINKHPYNNEPLPSISDPAFGPPRWWPEDGDVLNFGTGLATEMNVYEYINGPIPPPPGGLAYWPPNVTPQYPLTTPAWFRYAAPKAFKITVQLFDKNERIEGGQQFTMVFEIPGVEGM